MIDNTQLFLTIVGSGLVSGMNILIITIVSAAALGIVVLVIAFFCGFCIGAICLGASYRDKLQKHGLVISGDDIVSIVQTAGPTHTQPGMMIQ